VCIGARSIMVVTIRQAYDTNGFTFFTMAKDMKSEHQNIGITIHTED
jgi:hypothetical protein